MLDNIAQEDSRLPGYESQNKIISDITPQQRFLVTGNKLIGRKLSEISIYCQSQ